MVYVQATLQSKLLNITIAQGIGQITSDQQQDHILFEILPFETEHRRTPKNLEILPAPEIFCDKTCLACYLANLLTHDDCSVFIETPSFLKKRWVFILSFGDEKIITKLVELAKSLVSNIYTHRQI
ncbi:hypothetical protein, partial [Legionella sp.]|uniref:hypothetical protein n=1 Tax=Legionella sp. TaxID=459 RepID=UPI003CB5A1F4